MTERELIRDCQRGIKASQFELVKRYSAMLLSVCRRYAQDQDTAKDMLQESLIRIFRHIHKYKSTGSFEAWMRTIAVRCSIQWISKKHYEVESSVADWNEDQQLNPSVFDQYGVDEILGWVAELPLGFKTVFNLNVIEGYSHKEISELLGITESASRSQLVRARRLLQKKIELSKKRLLNGIVNERKNK